MYQMVSGRTVTRHPKMTRWMTTPKMMLLLWKMWKIKRKTERRRKGT